MAVLDIQHVNVKYKMEDREILACDDVNLQVDSHDAIGIVGESGSGKSTLAMAILGLLPTGAASVEGQIHFQGKNLVGLSREEYAGLRWKHLAAVFQKSMNSLSPVHKIGKQIEGIYRVHKPEATRAECRELAALLFSKVGLPPRIYDMYLHELSGGMSQRVSIALSLMFSPTLVILDEATTALDVVTEGQILEEIVRLQQSEEMTSIVITHNVSVVATTCKKVAVMYAGRLMESGSVERVLVEPKHPYTQGLLKSFPSFLGERESLRGIPGSLPDLSVRMPGCVFAPRCPYATERCRTQRPQDFAVENGWNVACFRVEDGENQ